VWWTRPWYSREWSGPAPHSGVEEDWRLVGLAGRLTFEKHPRAVVGEVEETAGQVDCDRARCFEVEEPDAGFAVREADVGSQVCLVEARQPPYGRKTDRSHAGHGERDQAEVCGSLEQVELELRGDLGAEEYRINGPVQKEEVTPVLPHDGPLARPLSWAEAVDRRGWLWRQGIRARF
jgi:hypothetical protein